MAYTRRSELTCTEEQMRTYPEVILRDGEIVRVRMEDGSVREKMGDGETRISELPYVMAGEKTYIRYSADADGRDFAEEWTEGLDYIGFAHGFEAPTDRTAYRWHLFAGRHRSVSVSGTALFLTQAAVNGTQMIL